MLLLCLCSAGTISAQQTNIWHFGINGGMDFNGGNPVPIGTGVTNAYEATASICDMNGNLLFYTEGTTVWDKNSNVMPNGSGLQGGASATQCLIVPKPGDCGKYYIFHVGDHISNNNAGDLRYTMVDMCLNNGLGDVITTQKNVMLNQPSAEKITAVRHANGTDIWVITHDRGNSDWRVFLVSALGVGAPVMSSAGAVHPANGMIGPVKASHNGLKLATACTFFPILDVLDFDPATGLVSNPVSYANLINAYGGRVYGVEFSPNDNLLYVTTCTTGNYVLQINLAATTILQLATVNQSAYDYGMVQTGPDGKLYIAHNSQNYLDVITSPNTLGVGCNFISAGFTLSPGTFSQMGLPNEVFWVYPTTGTFTFSLGNDTTACTPITINGPPACGATYSWSTGATTASITVSSPGTYYLDVNATCGTGSDTIVVLAGNPVVVLSAPVTICQNSSTTLAANGCTTYNWAPSTGLSATTGSSVTASPTVTTTYTVIGSSTCGSDTSTVMVTVDPLPVVNVPTPSPYCTGGSATLNASGGVSYSWTPATNLSSTTGQNVTANPAVTTTYTVFVTDNNGCSNSAGVVVTVNPLPTITVTGNVPVCSGDSLTLVASGGTIYSWSPATGLSASTGSTVIATPLVTTTYTVTGTNAGGCSAISVVTVTIFNNASAAFTMSSLPCKNEISFVNQSTGALDYLWLFGDGNTSTLQDPQHSFEFSGNYIITLIINPNTACADTSTQVLAYESYGVSDVYIPNAFTPNHNGLNDVFELYGPVNCNFEEIQVFDRWGELIFHSSDPEHVFWDGRINGTVVQEGVYVYRLVQRYDGESIIGSVTVIK